MLKVNEDQAFAELNIKRFERISRVVNSNQRNCTEGEHTGVQGISSNQTSAPDFIYDALFSPLSTVSL